MRRPVTGLGVLLATVATFAQAPDAWNHWEYSAPIEVPVTAASQLIAVVVPASVTARAKVGWEDLRVTDAEGREVPYIVHARSGGRTTEWRDARLLEPGFVPGRYTEATIDLGVDPGIHNLLRLRIDGHEDLQAWVEIATSSDASEWRILRERGPISRLSDVKPERTDVSYPDSRSRYVRVRILDATKRVPLVAAQVAQDVVTEAERVPAGIALAPAPSPPGQSVWLALSDTPRQPMAEVRFDTSQAQFVRPVVVETSEDGDAWAVVASGEIMKIVDSGQARVSLSVDLRESAGRRWRVTVRHGNDAALPDLRPALYLTPRRVVFRQEPGREYRLIYGNARAAAPRYDLTRLTDRKAIESAPLAALGAERANAGYRDSAPWTERHAYVLWAAVAVAVIVLGLVAVRSLRSAC